MNTTLLLSTILDQQNTTIGKLDTAIEQDDLNATLYLFGQLDVLEALASILSAAFALETLATLN